MFIAALFTIAKTWKQPRLPKQPKLHSTNEGEKKIWHIYIYNIHTHTVKYYSAIKNSEIMPFAGTWMDLEIIIQS